MKTVVLTAIIVSILFSGSAAVGADGQTIWQIGTPDRHYNDLAFDGDIHAYVRQFPTDVKFIVGKSEAKKDFSGIQPTNLDQWAGAREHPFEILFDLDTAPSGVYELRIDLVDTQSQSPPMLRVTVNDENVARQLPRGASDLSFMRPEMGKPLTLRFQVPAGTLRKTGNRIELRTFNGAWIIYDSVSFRRLGADERPPLEVTVTPTIFFVEAADGLRQELTIAASGLFTSGPVRAEVLVGTEALATIELDRPNLGMLDGLIHVPPTEADRELTVRLSAETELGTASCKQTPKRRWRIFVAPATHTDIGYTDLQERVIDRHNRNTDLALELLDEFPLYHWNLESSWAAQVWFRDRPLHRHRDLYEAARQRRIGIETTYLNMLTGLCSDEELIRNMYYSARIHRLRGVPFESHTLTDAPSHVWSLPSVLAGAGLNCLSVGVNQTRAPLFSEGIHLKSPFWWEGPDGARVLTWFADSYAQARLIGLCDGPAAMHNAIEAHMRGWDQRTDYPYDAILLHGAYFDNVAIGRSIGESITDYSKRYAYPKVILAANNQFADYIIENFEDRIPTVRGCGGSYWEDGAASTAVETGINRVAHQDVIAAEAAWAVASASGCDVDVPQRDLNRTWDNILLFDEHTWGAHNSIHDPHSDFVHRQWAYKADFAYKAAQSAQRLLDRALTTLAARVEAPNGSVLVFNPSGRSRTGVVEVEIPRGMVVVCDSGAVAQQVTEADARQECTVAFLATDVPAVGYRTYRVESAPESAAAPKRFDGTSVLENDYYRVTVDPASGGLASVFDKTLGKELVDASSPYKLGQLVYAAGGEEVKGQTQVACPDPAKVQFSTSVGAGVRGGARGTLFSSVQSVGRHDLFHRIELETILYEHERRIDFVCRLNKKMTYEKEAVYIAFPIAGANPQFRYEIANGNVRPNEDQFSGACRDWFAVQRWVTVHTDDAAVAWSPLDTPLVTLCDFTPGKWLKSLPITNGTIFAYVMNNYWLTNYKAGQDGPFTFRYSLTSDRAIAPEAAGRFGESAVAPMRALRLGGKRQASDLPPTGGYCVVEPANVQLTTVKPADDGKGLIVRVREIAGQPTTATIDVNFAHIAKAAQCDLVERVQKAVPLNSGKVSIQLGANAMATIRLEAE
ncbi:MAG: hypothetical protein JXA69_00825 [Phycisphaerae bacterium]|nr:hypothetical protein [Phycisphaerae bacterium]